MIPTSSRRATPLSGSASGTFNSNPVVAGFWGITPFQNGPDGANGVTPVSTQTALSATTAAFDPAVTSATGDLWLQAENASALVSPYVVAPGQTVKIPVTITPSGSPGSTVTGTLYVDDLTSVVGAATTNSLSLNINQASDLAAIPYTYTIGGFEQLDAAAEEGIEVGPRAHGRDPSTDHRGEAMSPFRGLAYLRLEDPFGRITEDADRPRLVSVPS